MTGQTALKIALEALLELSEYASHEHSSLWVQNTALDALREIRREHYLGSSSPVVAEALRADRL